MTKGKTHASRAYKRWATPASVMSAPRTSEPKPNKYAPHTGAKQLAKGRAPKSEPVGSEELKDAILAMIVREFGDRQVDWETVDRALSLVGFEIKQAALFAPPVEGGEHD